MLTRFFDASTNAVFATLAFALLLLTLSVLPAAANQNGSTVNGCSMAQLNSPGGARCVGMLENDIMLDRPTHHFAWCTSTGKIYCCEVNAATGAEIDHSCVKMSRGSASVYVPPPSLSSPGTSAPAGGTISGGVSGGSSNIATGVQLESTGSGPLL